MGHPAPSGVSIKIELESDMSVRTFVTSFLDGLTGEGIFGDLRIPGTPDRMFEEEPEHEQVVKEDEENDDRLRPQGSSEKSDGAKDM